MALAKRRAKTEKSEIAEAPLVPSELPEGWAVTTLGDGLIVEATPGFACGAHSRDSAGVAHLRPMNVNTDGRIDLRNVKYVPASAAAKADKWLETGDVLFNNTNSAELVGKTAIYDRDERLAFSNHMTRVRVRADGLDPHFCAHYLHANWRAGDFQARCNQHVSQASIGREALLETPIPVPPLAEQKRIADRIEALLKDVDAARERLARVPNTIKRLRQSVLAATCTGTLTESWRDAKSELPAPADRQAEGVRVIHEEDAPSEFVIPASWAWRRLGGYILDARYGTSVKCTVEKRGTPVLRVPNIALGALDLSNLKYATFSRAHLESLRLHEGDVVICRTNGSLDLVGKAAVFRDVKGTHAFASYLIRLRPDPSALLPEYLHLVLSSPVGRTQIEQQASTTAGQYNINLDILRNLLLPVPAPIEQQEVVRRAYRLLSEADSIEDRLASTTRTADKFAQAVLAKAFRGDLASTEAEIAVQEQRPFESGEELLRRIRHAPLQRKPRVIHVQFEDKVTIEEEVEMRVDRNITETHLRDILKKSKAGLSPERLLDESGLVVDDFYTQLKREVQAGHVRERRKDKQTVILEAVR